MVSEIKNIVAVDFSGGGFNLSLPPVWDCACVFTGRRKTPACGWGGGGVRFNPKDVQLHHLLVTNSSVLL